MPAKNRDLMKISGILTLIFGGLYLIFWIVGIAVLGLVPWAGDIGFLILDIFLGIFFLAGLVLILVATITPDYPLIIWGGGLFTIIFGGLFAIFSPGLHTIFISQVWYSFLFVIICGITALLFLIAGYQVPSLTPKRVAETLRQI